MGFVLLPLFSCFLLYSDLLQLKSVAYTYYLTGLLLLCQAVPPCQSFVPCTCWGPDVLIYAI